MLWGGRDAIGVRGRHRAFHVWTVGVAVVACVLLSAPVVHAQEPPPPAPPAAICVSRTAMAPEQLAACLAAGPVDLRDVTITGSLDLTDVGVISNPLRCINCTVKGGIRASDVTFERLIALERVTIEGDLDARGARFEGAVLARGRRGENPTGVRGDADFGLARFEEAVQLDATTFGGQLSFEGARFAGGVSMSGTELRAPANFDRIAVAETFALDGADPFDSTLEAATADASVSFRNATFGGDVELGGRRFRGGLVATGARVDGRLALRSAVVVGDAALDRITVDDLDATGLEVAVPTSPTVTCAQRDRSERGELDLTDLRAESMTLARAVVDELNLQGAQVSGQANVELTELTCDGSFDGFTADALSVDLSAVNRAAPSARLTMLQAVADTAREAGDLDLANEATYRRFVELNRDGPWIKRAADMVFYRGITGYLVKPLRPLAGLLVLLLIGTTVRFVASGRERVPAGKKQGFFAASPSDFASTCDRLGVALGETGRAIVRPAPKFPPGSNFLMAGTIGRLLEYLVSKILLIILVIAISNNSAALDQIVEGILP